MTVKAVNAVIQPGQTLLEVVPTSDEMVVEARISPRAIGNVHLEQPVDVRVATYDFSRFGSVPGTIRQISASTFALENGERYYRAVIALGQDYVGENPDFNKVIPGMTVQANIKTGSKSILDYLLKPVYRGFAQSFGEK
jgi:HlyD family type I secretion membrane fusion protein